MNTILIFWPVVTLMGWTFFVLLLIPYRRFKTGFSTQITINDFRYGESENILPFVKIPNRAFINLFEMPVIFYTLSIVLYTTHNVDLVFLLLTWSYVVFRILHSIIYLTYNNVIHRLLAFSISNLLILAIWLRFIFILSGNTLDTA